MRAAKSYLSLEAGISRSSGLPDFRELVSNVYEKLDKPVHDVLLKISGYGAQPLERGVSGLTDSNQRRSRDSLSATTT